MKPWGYHLVIDCSSCNLDAVKNQSIIKDFVETIIRRIDMVPHGNIQLYYMDDQGDNNGWSLVQMIKTSNITAHFVDKDGSAFIDIFSCKEYNVDTVLETVKEFFSPQHLHYELLQRYPRLD